MSGPVLLVTGGSRGIGRSVCLLAAQRGWQVAVNYVADTSAAHAVVTEIRAEGGSAESFQADVGVTQDIQALFAAVKSRFGQLDGFCKNAASKDAIDTLTVGLARELAAEGIRVNAVRPGMIDTDIHGSGGLPDRAWDLAPTVPMQRPGSPDEIAEAELYLLSPQASYATGAIINVSGGR